MCGQIALCVGRLLGVCRDGLLLGALPCQTHRLHDPDHVQTRGAPCFKLTVIMFAGLRLVGRHGAGVGAGLTRREFLVENTGIVRTE